MIRSIMLLIRFAPRLLMDFVAACWLTTEVIVRANVVPEVGGGTSLVVVHTVVVLLLRLLVLVCGPAAETLLVELYN